MKIKASDLRRILEIILTYEEEIGNTEFEIDVDYYWHIPKEIRYDPYSEPEPADLTLGQLTFDWEELERLQADESRAIGYCLAWLGQILIAIGEEYP